MGKIRVVVGGLYGSESKGRTAGFLLNEKVSPEAQLTIRVGGPQAGHIVTGDGPDGPEHHWKLRSVPVGSVCRKDAQLAIASGSEIDPERLNTELDELDAAGYRASHRLLIDEMATWMSPEHKFREASSDITARLGSTSTGVGEARTDRIMRRAMLARDNTLTRHGDAVTFGTVRDVANDHLNAGNTVLIEAAQGCHLDLFRGPYPFATSGRTTAIDALASAEVVPWQYPQSELQVWLAVRVNPIRVGGNSGPMDNEISWEDLGVDPEITTVTKRVRRVAQWNPSLVAQSVDWCGGAPTVRLSMSHLDYLFPEVADAKSVDDFPKEAIEWLLQAEQDCGAQIALVGVSPSTTLVFRDELI